jgi:Cu2+-exporting ATPase
VAAGPGTAVHAGTLNVDAPVDVRVSAVGQDTALAEIARLMEAAGQSRSYVRIADRASRLYAPAVHTLAALTFAGWMMAGAGLYKSLVIAIAVLIITCPCALGLAVPVAQVVAAGALMKRGILVKDGSALERLAAVDRALLDKTGTLTLGRPVPDGAALGAFRRRGRKWRWRWPAIRAIRCRWAWCRPFRRAACGRRSWTMCARKPGRGVTACGTVRG